MQFTLARVLVGLIALSSFLCLIQLLHRVDPHRVHSRELLSGSALSCVRLLPRLGDSVQRKRLEWQHLRAREGTARERVDGQIAVAVVLFGLFGSWLAATIVIFMGAARTERQTEDRRQTADE